MSDHSEIQKPESWSVFRWKQFRELERLLNDCESINNSLPIIQHLERIIKRAKKLNAWDRNGARKSFKHFIQDQAVYYYATKKRRKKKSTTF